VSFDATAWLPSLARAKDGVDAAPESGITLAEKLDDEALLNRIQAGEQEALGYLFERHALLIRGIATRILRDTAEAEDLVQDVFLFIQRRCGIFDSSKSSARSWIIQIDAVFVTVEPNGGSHKPSGKPLLFAYLKVDPNHP